MTQRSFDPAELIRQEEERRKAAENFLLYVDSDGSGFDEFELSMRRAIDTSDGAIDRIFTYKHFSSIPPALEFLRLNSTQVLGVWVNPGEQTVLTFAEGNRLVISQAFKDTMSGDCSFSWLAEHSLIREKGRSLGGEFNRSSDHVFDKSQISSQHQIMQMAGLVKETLARRSSLIRIELEGKARDAIQDHDLNSLREEVKQVKMLAQQAIDLLTSTNRVTGEAPITSRVEGLQAQVGQHETEFDRLVAELGSTNRKIEGIFRKIDQLSENVENKNAIDADYRSFRIYRSQILFRLAVAALALLVLSILMGGIDSAIQAVLSIVKEIF